MKLRFERLFLACFLALGAATASVAEIMVAPSVEWQCCAAEVIVVGKISKIVTTPGPGSVTYEDCVVDLAQVIKGGIGDKQIAFTLRRVGAGPTAQPLLAAKADVLLFLSRSKDHGSEKHLDQKWVPALGRADQSIIDLSKPLKKVYSKEMKGVTDKKELLKIASTWAKSPVKQELWSNVPHDSAIHGELWAGSGVYLLVPAEAKFHAHFLKMARSDNAYERAKAAGELRKFPGAETEAVLRELLKDSSESQAQYSQDQISSVSYFVRAAAYHSLKELGKPVPELVLERKPTAAEQSALRKQCWTKSFTEALNAGWTISVADGPLAIFDGREESVVVVTCRQGNQEVKFTLVPKLWPAEHLPKQGYLGMNGKSSQGSRLFYLEGKPPGDVKQQVVSYFGLEK